MRSVGRLAWVSLAVLTGAACVPATGGDASQAGAAPIGDGGEGSGAAPGTGAAPEGGGPDAATGSVGSVVIDVQETFVDGAANPDIDGVLSRTGAAFQLASDHDVPFFITFEASQSGEVFAMAGASFEHNLVVANIVGGLWTALRRKPSSVSSSDLRVFIPATGRYVFPDASVVCGEPRFTDEQKDTLCNPQVVFEVLSDTTEAYDRGETLAQYRTVDSLCDHVLLSQRNRWSSTFAASRTGRG